MKTALVFAAAACAMVGPAAAVQAQEIKAQEGQAQPSAAAAGWYATAGIGGAWAASPSSSTTQQGSLLGVDYAAAVSGTTSLGRGVAVDAGIGYGFGRDFRSELTYVFTRPSLGSSSFHGHLNAVGLAIPFSGDVSGAGSVNTHSIFVSGYYDLPTKSRFRPYVGAGIGWTNIAIPSQTFAGTLSGFGVSSAFRTDVNGGSASAFGYQAKLGLSYLASPSTDLFLEGTYQGNTSVTIASTEIGAINQFGVRAGLRYRFGG